MAKQYPDDSTTLHTDAYELSMIQTYFEKGIQNKKAIFEVYFRDMPFKNGFAVLRASNTLFIISKIYALPIVILTI